MIPYCPAMNDLNDGLVNIGIGQDTSYDPAHVVDKIVGIIFPVLATVCLCQFFAPLLIFFQEYVRHTQIGGGQSLSVCLHCHVVMLFPYR